MTYPPQPTGGPVQKSRPGTVTFAVLLQVLLALGIVATTVGSFLYGADAADAFEAELQRQGFDWDDVADTGINEQTYEPGGLSLIVPILIIVGLLVLALLNNNGNRVSRILTWILQPLVLVCGGFILAAQVFAAQFMQYGFDSQDIDIDADALLDALNGAYPGWFAIIGYVVFALATLGSLLIIILLAVPSSNAFFRKEPPETYIPGAPLQ